MFDPERKNIWDNKASATRASYKITVRIITSVHETAMAHGRTITMNQVFANFEDIGLTADGISVTNVDRVKHFIDSHGVMELF